MTNESNKKQSGKTPISRRAFMRSAAAGIAASPLILPSTLGATLIGSTGSPQSGAIPRTPYIRNSKISRKVIVLGIDGMDPKLTRKMMEAGELPTFRRLAEQGHFGPLQTTMPPQSPVAWSSFITGTNPGGHGIYDFIHRDPATFTPYLSTSRSFDATRKLTVGNWNIPLESGEVKLMRHGTPFWNVLDEAQIPSTIFALPANFPVEPASDRIRALSGMGTPDLLGGYGSYLYITENRVPGAENFSGGKVERVALVDHRVQVDLEGPRSPFHTDSFITKSTINIARDPIKPAVKIDLQGTSMLLHKGEWSDWVPVSFEFLPVIGSVAGMVRFYVKDVHPKLTIYVSPINVDPVNPAMPICNPENYSAELAAEVGRFYTQGLPANTKAHSEGVLDSYDFLMQSKLILQENLKAFDYELQRFHEGCLVFYFSSIDQNSHMLWRCMDPKHPLYEPKAAREVKQAIPDYYRAMDKVLAQTLSKVDSTTALYVLSDHGFTTFEREFHLNTWLVEKGFIVPTDPKKIHSSNFFDYVDWGRTTAYALGINGLYINLRGREKNGSVSAADAPAIKKALIEKLHEVIDPKNGKRVVEGALDSQQIFSGPYASLAPDIMVGYADGYRISDESILGKFPEGIIGDRTDKWSADHCMHPSVVPGVILSNRKCSAANPGLWDLAPSILGEFGLTAPDSMTGKKVFSA